jgi:hypothetical protein
MRRPVPRARAAHRHGRYHRHAQRIAQRRGIDDQPVALGEVDHVERHHDRPAQLDQFLREDQVLFEVGGIEHDHQHVGLRLAGKFAQHHAAGHFLVGLDGSSE